MSMEGRSRLNIEDLRQLCQEREEESSILEFKPCQELKIGTDFYDKRIDDHRRRQKDDVLAELTKDVTALLNSAGGTIIYGILEDRKSRAKKLDDSNVFRSDSKTDNVSPEKVADWLRYHIKPPPLVDVYPIFEDDDKETSWYLVIEVPQGQLAYQAKDKRFYRRIGPTVQRMEQYEVADVMNRTRAAELELRIAMTSDYSPGTEWTQVCLQPRITSRNYVASEYGALKLTLAYPLRWARKLPALPRLRSTGLRLRAEIAHAESIMLHWGAHNGTIVFPGDWFDFPGMVVCMHVPSPSFLPGGTYLFQAELFTMNSQAAASLFAIQQEADSNDFDLSRVDSSTHEHIEATFWSTYHTAMEKLERK